MSFVVAYEDVREEITKLAEPLLLHEGLELVDVEYRMENGQWIVRVFIDKEGGVTLGDCAKVSRELGNLLDIKDIIIHEYNLEVSSPGLDRPLVKEIDFLKNKGKKVKIKVGDKIEDRRNFTGILEGIDGDDVILKGEQGDQWRIPFANIDKARLVHDFDS
jgi:ribosome maturation factor RimP